MRDSTNKGIIYPLKGNSREEAQGKYFGVSGGFCMKMEAFWLEMIHFLEMNMIFEY